MKTKETFNVENAILKALSQFGSKVKTITCENRTEFTNHNQIAKELQMDWYFAEPYKSQQGDCNKNQNGLLWQYFKNNTDLNLITEKQLK